MEMAPAESPKIEEGTAVSSLRCLTSLMKAKEIKEMRSDSYSFNSPRMEMTLVSGSPCSNLPTKTNGSSYPAGDFTDVSYSHVEEGGWISVLSGW